MTVRLNHTIAGAHDKEKSARFMSEILGLPSPRIMGHFAVVEVGDELTIDFVDVEGDFERQHYAFLVSEAEFDQIFTRIKAHGLSYWGGPFHGKPGEINHWDDGRGVYFDDPDGHSLEILTRPYGSAGPEAKTPHPFVAGDEAE